MSSDSDDALHWEGDDDEASPRPVLPRGWTPLGKGAETVVRPDAERHDSAATDEAADIAEEAEPPAGMSTAALVTLGVLGGIYLLYIVGWFVDGLRLQGTATYLVTDVMYQVSLWGASLAPALWFLCVWVLTRKARTWARLLGLLLGVVVLIPWPFAMLGAGA